MKKLILQYLLNKNDWVSQLEIEKLGKQNKYLGSSITRQARLLAQKGLIYKKYINHATYHNNKRYIVKVAYYLTK